MVYLLEQRAYQELRQVMAICSLFLPGFLAIDSVFREFFALVKFYVTDFATDDVPNQAKTRVFPINFGSKSGISIGL
jgi:hypothetical protein